MPPAKALMLPDDLLGIALSCIRAPYVRARCTLPLRSIRRFVFHLWLMVCAMVTLANLQPQVTQHRLEQLHLVDRTDPSVTVTRKFRSRQVRVL